MRWWVPAPMIPERCQAVSLHSQDGRMTPPEPGHILTDDLMSLHTCALKNGHAGAHRCLCQDPPPWQRHADDAG